MSTISSVSGASAATYVSKISTKTAQATEATTEAGASKLSKMGELMSQLQDLQKSDPDKAKAVLSKISEALSAKADELGDSKMKDLATKFGEAAKTGDLSGLKPKGPPPSGGPPPGGKPHTDSTSSKLAAYEQNTGDPMEAIESIISSALEG